MIQYLKFDYKNLNPFQQGIFAALLVTFIALFCLIFHQNSMQAWDMLLTPILLFCFYNPILGAFQQKPLRYFGLSVFVFISIAVYIYLTGNFISSFSYQQTGELHLFAVLIVVFYFLLNLLTLLFRGILYLLKHIDE